MRLLIAFLLLFVHLGTVSSWSDEVIEIDSSRHGRKLTQQDERVVEVSTDEELRVAARNLQRRQTIILASGTFTLSRSITVSVPNVQMIGSVDGTVIQCPPGESALIIRSRNFTVSQLNFEDCEDAPAVTVESIAEENSTLVSATFETVSFRNNIHNDGFAAFGGGILIRGCISPPCLGEAPRVSVVDSIFEENEASEGAGIFCENCELRVVDCTFSENVAQSGGGAISVTREDSVLEVLQSVFVNNSVVAPGRSGDLLQLGGLNFEPDRYFSFQFPSNGGGAIATDTVLNITVTDCIFRNNIAPAGGAVSMTVIPVSLFDLSAARSSVSISECTFEQNQARLSPVADSGEMNMGGAIYVVSGADVVRRWSLTDCLFRQNSARYGGALHIVTVNQQNSFAVNNCTFQDNNAQEAGGAMLLRNTNPFSVNASRMERNSANLGGAVYLTNNAFFRAEGLAGLPEDGRSGIHNVFDNNTAVYGGGLMCAGCGDLTLIDVNFTRNNASRTGGGLYVLDSAAETSIWQGYFHSNMALQGGGAAFRTTAEVNLNRIVPSLENVFINNTAVAGAGLFVEITRHQRNRLQISGCRFEANNAVNVSDPRFPFQEEARLNLTTGGTGRSLLQENDIPYDSQLSEMYRLTDCGNGGGGAICLICNDIPEDSLGDLLVEDVIFNENRALVGGGMHINIAGEEWNAQRQVRCDPARPSATTCRLFRILNATLTNNVATFGGAGLFVSRPETILVGCDNSDIDDWEQLLSAGRAETLSEQLCLRSEGNTVQDGEGLYGRTVASVAYSLVLIEPLSAVIKNHTGGERLLPPCADLDTCDPHRTDGIKIAIRDAFNQTITGGIPDAEFQVLLVGELILGEQIYAAEKGIININTTLGLGVNETSNVSFQGVSNSNLRTSLTFGTRQCYPGERETRTECEPCLTDQYAFNTSSSCRDCESDAECAGRSALVPNDGFWHSTPFSPQFHDCIVREACSYDDRAEILSQYYVNGSRMAERIAELESHISGEAEAPEYPDYNQCAAGYTGVLCGSCLPGYGHFAGGECVECPTGNSSSVVIISLTALWTFFLIAANILMTLSSTRKQIWIALAERTRHGRMSMRIPRFASPSGDIELTNISHPRINVTDEDVSAPLSARGLASNKRVRGPRVPRRTDHIVALEKLTEIVKILVNYLQVTSVAISINVTWNSIVETFLSIQVLAVSVTSGSHFVPLDCTFDDTHDRIPDSVKAWLLRVFFPLILLGVFLGLVLLFHAVRPQRRTHNAAMTRDFAAVESIWTYITVIVLVVIYFSYINMTSEFMRAVNCIEVDEVSEQMPHEYDRYAIATGSRVWAEDTSLHCFEGNHTATGVFGALFLVFFSSMVIASIVIWLPWNRHRLNDADFIARYGFIYQGYRHEMYTIPWEAVVTVRKALIAAAVVFAFPLGPNLQIVCALGVIILATAVHLIFRPFKSYEDHPNIPEYSGRFWSIFGMSSLGEHWIRLNNIISLNSLETASLLMSMTVFYSGVLFNDPNTSQAGKYTMATFTMIVNVAFILYILYRLYFGAHLALDMHFIYFSQGSQCQTKGLTFPTGGSFLLFLRKLIAMCKYVYYHREEVVQLSEGVYPVEEMVPAEAYDSES